MSTLSLNPVQLNKARAAAVAKMSRTRKALATAEDRVANARSTKAREEYDEANRRMIALSKVAGYA